MSAWLNPPSSRLHFREIVRSEVVRAEPRLDRGIDPYSGPGRHTIRG
jgi:hypothetical protein